MYLPYFLQNKYTRAQCCVGAEVKVSATTCPRQANDGSFEIIDKPPDEWELMWMKSPSPKIHNDSPVPKRPDLRLRIEKNRRLMMLQDTQQTIPNPDLRD